MKKATIPVYDICSLMNEDSPASTELLAERFSVYLDKYYHRLHFPHRHSFYHLVLFTKGSGTHTIDFVRFPVKPGQLYFMTPGQVHSWHFKKGVDGYIINFSAGFFHSFLANRHYLDQFSFLNGIAEEGVLQLSSSVLTDVIRLLEQIVSTPSSIQNEDRKKIWLLELLLMADTVSNQSTQRKFPSHKYLVLRNFQKLVDQDYRTNRLPKKYASLLYITPNHLNALCQEMLGKSAGEVIRDRVVLEAKRLLTNDAMNITAISDNLNFKDNSYFNRFFKKSTGCTPDEFRKQLIIS